MGGVCGAGSGRRAGVGRGGPPLGGCRKRGSLMAGSMAGPSCLVLQVFDSVSSHQSIRDTESTAASTPPGCPHCHAPASTHAHMHTCGVQGWRGRCASHGVSAAVSWLPRCLVCPVHAPLCCNLLQPSPAARFCLTGHLQAPRRPAAPWTVTSHKLQDAPKSPSYPGTAFTAFPPHGS